jgi:hypothetical protein
MRARFLRAEGKSEEAADDLEVALRRLHGEELVDALGFAAAVADDRQRPQAAEHWVAMAELEAAHQLLPAKVGSLLTLHARELSRIGFPRESEAAYEKGAALIETHGTPKQRFFGRQNRAWMWLDRGEVRKAEALFATLCGEAEELEGETSLADKQAYWARALFGAGHPELALAAASRAQALAEQSRAVAPALIATLAECEGCLFFDRFEQALVAADRALDLCLMQMPVWENVCRYLRSRALLGIGDLAASREEATRAIEASPMPL